MASASADAEAAAPYEALPEPRGKDGPKMSMAASVLNLVKVVVGCGALSLPQGLASFSDRPGTGLGFGITAMALFSSASGYCFWQIGRMCAVTGESTYAGAFGKVFGARRRWLVSVSSSVFCGSVCLMYCIIIADNSRDLAVGCGLSGAASGRSALLALVGLLVLLPLSLLRSLAALAPFSALGLLGMVFIDAFCGLRYVEGAYEPGGRFSEEARWKPSFGAVPPSVLPAFVLTSMLATAFIGHFSAPRFWAELERPTVQRFAVVTGLGFVGAFATTCLVMVFGFLTFGSASQGLILNNYATADGLAIVSRLGVVASIVCAFPFVVAACRDDLLQLAVPGGASEPLRAATTVAIVLASVAVGSVFDNLGFLVALAGALLATALVYLFPAAMLVGHLGPRARSGVARPAERLELRLNQALLALGVVLSVVGAVVTFLQYFWPQALSRGPR